MVKKPKKPKKPKKDKSMAWTPAKAQLLGTLFKERLEVENDPKEIERWGLTRTWGQILNNNVPDSAKQTILNDLIDDKIVFLDVISNEASASITEWGTDIVNLTANKE